MSVEVTSHEDSGSTLLRGALPAQTTDLAVLIHLGRAKRQHLIHARHLLAPMTILSISLWQSSFHDSYYIKLLEVKFRSAHLQQSVSLLFNRWDICK